MERRKRCGEAVVASASRGSKCLNKRANGGNGHVH